MDAVAKADVELDKTADIPNAIKKLRVIRAEMAQYPKMAKAMYDLDIVRAQMEPFLIFPNMGGCA